MEGVKFMSILNVNITEECMEILDKVAGNLYEGKKGVTANAFIESGCLMCNGELIKVSDVVNMPSLSLKRLKFRGSVRTAFKRNFEKLPFIYKKNLFILLYILCEGKDKKKRLMYNEVFLAGNENISVNYTRPEWKYKDPKHCASMGLYLNVKGRIGSIPIRAYTDSRHDSIVDPNSLIWISRTERFISDKFYDPNDETIYTEILKALNIKDRLAIQLDYTDLDKLIEYFKNELDTSEIDM